MSSGQKEWALDVESEHWRESREFKSGVASERARVIEVLRNMHAASKQIGRKEQASVWLEHAIASVQNGVDP
jgi:hypothetical protein